MSSFAISVHPTISTTPLFFEFWRGEAPQLIHEIVQQFTKPGRDGHGERKLGKWSTPITCQLESHWTSYVNAMNALPTYYRVPGSGLVQVVYNNVAFADVGIGFTVQSVKLENETHARLLQLGPYGTYSGAGILLTTWQMTAISTGA